MQGLDAIGSQFDERHKQLFTFALDVDKEVVNLRAVVEGRETRVSAGQIEKGDSDPSAAILAKQTVFMDGKHCEATIFARAKLKSGNQIIGPAIITEMDSTSVILVGHVGDIDDFGNILIRPIVRSS